MGTVTRHRVENAAELSAFLVLRPGDRAFPAADVANLQAIARRLHRLDERSCNEDLTCPKCRGDGYGTDKRDGLPSSRVKCRACAGRGSTTGRTEARLEQQARDIATRYGCRLYVQGDPRGWPLYLIPNESGPAAEDDSRYNQRGTAVCPH